MSDLSLAQVESALDTAWMGRKAYYFRAVGSTNDELQRLADAGAPPGTLVVANTQTAGRGRAGRRWYAPPGTALLFSVLLRPRWGTERAAWISMIAGLAARRAVHAVGNVPARLKWPNDVVVGSGRDVRKLGGILVEAGFEGERLARAVVGVGINVEMARQQLPKGNLPPTSIRLERGEPGGQVDRPALLAALLAEFERLYEAADRGESPHASWNEALVWRNRPVCILQSDRQPALQGRFHGVDDLGRLLIVDDEGVSHAAPSGDLSLRL